jgi:hypothetical protein
MILKETDKKNISTKYEQAGLKAELQMAHYLKRAFEKIYVLNDLRIEHKGEVAQVDHLLVTKFGFIVIESKSVTGKIAVNKFQEWKRIYQSNERGMPSPIEQGKRQMALLIDYLQEHNEVLLRDNFATKMLGKVKFHQFHQEVLVAISDQGIIERQTDLPNVLKADSIPSRIQEILSELKKKSLNPLGKIVYGFHNDTHKKIAKFLKRSHKPKEQANGNQYAKKYDTVQEPKIQYERKIQQEHRCAKCNSINLNITYGKYGYYFKCKDCNRNTHIPLKHKSENCSVRIKKDKNNFYLVCKTCNTEELFFTNY